MGLAVANRSGPYEIVGMRGAGGMREVYRAYDTRLSRAVALKVLPEMFAQDPDRRSRFEKEARILGALNHPNILAIFDVGTDRGTFFVVSELLDGETLSGRIFEGPMPLSQARDYAVPITRGLAFRLIELVFSIATENCPRGFRATGRPYPRTEPISSRLCPASIA